MHQEQGRQQASFRISKGTDLLSINNNYFAYLKGALVFSYFLLRGVQLDELIGQRSGNVDFSIGTYLLGGGVVLFSLLTMVQKNVAMPTQFFYMFGVIFLTTFSFLFWDNLNAGTGHMSLYIEYMSSLTLVFFIYFTFQTQKEIEIFFKSLTYACLIISLFWITNIIQNPGAVWRTGNILGDSHTYSATSYQLVGAIWAAPLVNLLDSHRPFHSKLLRDFPLLIIFVFGLVFLGAKGGALIFIIILCFFWFLYFKGMKKEGAVKFFSNLFPLLILVALAIGYALTNLGQSVAPVERIFGLFSKGGSGGRLDIWMYSLGMSFSDLPGLLIGKGFGNFFLLGAGKWPHNFFLDLAFNAGFPAALLLIFWIFKIWRSNYKYMKQEFQNPALRKLMLQTIGWGIVGCFYAFGGGKFSSATMLWFFLALSIRIHQLTLQEIKAANQGRKMH